MKKNIFFLLVFLSHLLLANAGTKTVNEASSAAQSQSDPWVRETGLQYNMPILARVYKDGVLFQPTGLMLAVIKNGKCWGFSGLSNGPAGIKLHNITIGCNNESEAGFNYQCYDPNTSTYYDIVETVDFKSLTPVGKINAPISINIKSATPQTITFGTLTAKVFGDAPFSVSASGGASGNPVIFTSSNAAVATCTGTNGSTVTIVGVGSCTIYANQAGNSNYAAATQVSQSLVVNKASQSISLFDAIAAKTLGDAPFTVSATGGASGNPVTFTSSDATVATCTGTNGSTITIVGAGSCTINANQAGNSNYDAATQVSQSLVVNKASQLIISFGAIASKNLGDPSITLSAVGGASGNPVTFTSSNTSVATCTGVNGTTLSFVGVGTCTIYANQAGNTNYYAASQVSQSVTVLAVVKTSQTISFGALSSKTFGADPFTVSATGGASGNPITFSSSNNAIVTCSGTNGSTITIVGVGTCSIIANQAGNALYDSATSVSQSLTVNAIVGSPWVRETGLQYNMPILAQVFNGGVIYQPVGLLLGVFKGGKCYGYSGLSNGPAGIKLHNITIGCNNESEAGFNYIAYDPNIPKFFTITETVDFKSLTPVGKINAPIRINVADIPTDITSPKNDKIAIYPNPIESTFYIGFNETASRIKVDLYTIQGALLSNLFEGANSGANVLSLQRNPNLSKGVYLLNVTIDNKKFIQKVVLN
ncbi:MAG: T9SS type A sorting domain-containing protein [Bacteroidales bacterium]